jgi:hypothetical protein
MCASVRALGALLSAVVGLLIACPNEDVAGPSEDAIPEFIGLRTFQTVEKDRFTNSPRRSSVEWELLQTRPIAGQKYTLWELDDSVLFPAFCQFVQSPGTNPDRQFVQLEKRKDGKLQFRRVPEKWFAWPYDGAERGVIGLDRNGFRVLIYLKYVPAVREALVERVEKTTSSLSTASSPQAGSG